MHLRTELLTILVLCAVCGVALGDDAKEQPADHFQAFAPFVGKTWKGEFAKSTPEKPLFDVARWERILNGNGIRVTHSVNDGVYGGETIVIWDAKKNSLAYWYFTTAGFYTQGTMTSEEGKLLSHEVVTGNPQGITEVKATSELLPDGRLHVKSQYHRDGKWSDGHEVFYKEAPDATVKFKD